MPDVVCLGELLIDFVACQPNRALSDVLTFRRAPGGAPANVACGGAAAQDSSARPAPNRSAGSSRKTLQDAGVDTSRMDTWRLGTP